MLPPPPRHLIVAGPSNNGFRQKGLFRVRHIFVLALRIRMFSLAQVPGDMQQCDDARKCICKRGCDAFETERETAVDGQVLP